MPDGADTVFMQEDVRTDGDSVVVPTAPDRKTAAPERPVAASRYATTCHVSDGRTNGSNLPLLWDIKRAASLADLIGYIEEPALRRLVEATLDRFVTRVQPVLDTLRSQVIHNDMNPGNLLIDSEKPDRISGIIDFGDLTKSPQIIDLAVAAAYQLSPGDDPLAGVLPMISGYHGIEPLQPAEMEILTDLIRTRLITSLLIGSYRATLFPENREYLLISHHSAKSFLLSLKNLPADEALERIRAACLKTRGNAWVETP